MHHETVYIIEQVLTVLGAGGADPGQAQDRKGIFLPAMVATLSRDIFLAGRCRWKN